MWIVAMGIVFLVWLIVISTAGEQDWNFRYDSRNPARRWCCECGQRQELMCRSYDNLVSWWEDVGKELNTNCQCSNHQEYRR
jgi:hypothetical protein